MKYNYFLGAILIMMIAVTGCSNKYELEEEPEVTESKYEPGEESEPTESKSEPEEESGSTEVLFPDYVYDNNQAQLQSVSNIAISENGYYSVINGLLYYYDIDTCIMTPCCYDASCTHLNKNCGAYLHDKSLSDEIIGNEKEDEVDICYGDAVFYYNDKLYMVENNKDSEYYLNQYSSRFGDMKRVAVLADNDNKDLTTYLWNSSVFKVKDGYLYYVSHSFNPDKIGNDRLAMTTYNCMRVKLDSDTEPEKLGEFEIIPYGQFGRPEGFKILFDENSVYYIAGGEGTLFVDVANYCIARYNTDNGNFDIVLDYSGEDGVNAFGDGISAPQGIDDDWCMDMDSNLYMVSESERKIIQYSVNDKSGNYLYTSKNLIKHIATDGEYLFLTECASNKGESAIVVINLKGEVISRSVLEYDSDYAEMIKSYDQDLLSKVVKILGVDDRYIMISTTETGLKGLSANYRGVETGFFTMAEALIDKRCLIDGSDVEIKQIYQYN